MLLTEHSLMMSQMRALDHAVELMYHPLASEVPTKRLCLEAIKDLFTYLPQSKASPDDTEIRSKLFLACYASLFPFLFSGGVGLSHSIGHAIGASYGIPHGITSCLSLAPVVRLKASNPNEAKQIARIIPYLGKVTSGDDSKDAQVVADAIATLVEELGLKTTLTAVRSALASHDNELTWLSIMCPLATRRKTPLRLAHCMATKIMRTLRIVRDFNRYLLCRVINLLTSETNHSRSLLNARDADRMRVRTRSTTRSHMDESMNFPTVRKTCPYPRPLVSSEAALSQSYCCTGTFPTVVRLSTYPRQVSPFSDCQSSTGVGTASVSVIPTWLAS